MSTPDLWEFDPDKHQTLIEFFGTTHGDIWKMLFEANETWPATTEDPGHDLAHPASSLSFSHFKVYPLLAYSRKMPKLSYFFQGWTKKAERIQCPAPLPEEPAIPLLTKMLVPAPYQVPEKKAKKKATGTRKSSRHMVVSDSSSDESETHSSREDEEEEEETSPPPTGGGKKRKAAPTGEAGGSKKGKTLPPDCSTDAADDEEEWQPRAKPLAKS